MAGARAALASVGLHACLAAVLSALPDPPRRRPPSVGPLTFDLTPATPPPPPAATAPPPEGGTVPALRPRGTERRPTGRPSSGSRPAPGGGVLGMRGTGVDAPG